MPVAESVRELEPLIAIPEAARVLNVSEDTIYRLLRSGELEHVKIGGRTVFEPATLRKFIAARRRRRGSGRSP